jgi:hypothetical protein
MKGAAGFMSRTGTHGSRKRDRNLTQHFNAYRPLEVGDLVRVCRKLSPLFGQIGKVVEVAFNDVYGPFLVRFENGFRFRYQRSELAALTSNIDSAGDKS